MQCPRCQTENQPGKYCSNCGAPLDVTCGSCGAAALPGARFCTQCGEPLGGRTRGLRPAWVIGAIAVGVTAAVLVLLGRGPGVDPGAGFEAAGASGGAEALTGPGAGAPPPLSADMRTNADRLFNRVMGAAEAGNTAEASRFLPMAIQAYQMVPDLDADGLYHLALLQLTAGQPDSARATARLILTQSPDHIFGLAVDAAAAAEAGDSAAARSQYQRLLRVYDQEAGKPRVEYVDHARMLPAYRSAAEAFVR